MTKSERRSPCPCAESFVQRAILRPAGNRLEELAFPAPGRPRLFPPSCPQLGPPSAHRLVRAPTTDRRPTSARPGGRLVESAAAQGLSGRRLPQAFRRFSPTCHRREVLALRLRKIRGAPANDR